MSNEMYLTPGHLLRRAHQIAATISAEELADLGLTTVQYTTLVSVHDNPGIDITALSGLVAYDRSTLGGVLDRLEEKKLIERKAVDSDKRVRLLYTTHQGGKLANDSVAASLRAQERILGPLGAGERAQLTRLLAKLIRLQTHNLPASVRIVMERVAD